MAIGPLQESGVTMTSQLCHCLLVHSVVEHGKYEIVPEGVKVKFPWESVLIVETAKVPGKSIGVYRFTVLVREHIIAHLKTAFLRLVHFVVAVTAKDTGHLLADIDCPGLTIRELRHFVATLEATGDDRRRQVMVMNVLAAGMEISDDALRSLRGRCVQNVKKTSGSVTLDKAVEYQRGGV